MKRSLIFAGLLMLTSCGQGGDSAPASAADESSKMTLAEFSSVKIGTSYEEATTIVGGVGAVVSETDSGGYHTIAYRYEGIGDMGANGNFVFQNGKLINKSQFGLK